MFRVSPETEHTSIDEWTDTRTREPSLCEKAERWRDKIKSNLHQLVEYASFITAQRKSPNSVPPHYRRDKFEINSVFRKFPRSPN